MRQPVKSLSSRIGLIDEVRGFAIICMVFYHAGYDMTTFLGIDLPFFFHPAMNFVRDVFAFGFIFISGAACRFSRSNLRRGAICFGLGLVMTAATAIFASDQLIRFGILHCLGVCMMLFPLISKLLDRVSAPIGVGVLLLLFFLTQRMMDGYLGIGALRIELPDVLYSTEWLFPIGLPAPGFSSSDYFPLLPWLFAFCLGSYFGRWLKNGNPPDWLKRTHLRPLAFVGRHTIWIYLLHQPVLMAIFWGISIMMGTASFGL